MLIDSSPGVPPVATSEETVDAILAQGGRDHSPIRVGFVQSTDMNGRRGPGPLADLVGAGDRRALLLYLLLLTKATSDPWDAALPSAVWARALGYPLPNTRSAASMISKAWMRIERRSLVVRARSQRMTRVTLLREDGSGAPYTHPGTEGRYIKLAHAFWQAGPSRSTRWYQVLDLPEIAMLLIALTLRGGFRLPAESGPAWYGISADTVSRGLRGLAAHDLVVIDKSFKPAPLAPAGYTAENRYTLLDPFSAPRPRRRVVNPGTP